MSAFTVSMKDQPGELAHLTERIADRGANLMLCGVSAAGQGVIALVANDDSAVRSALDGTGSDCHERDTLTVRLSDEPGQAALLAGRLRDAHVNIELLLPTRICDGQVELTLCVSDDAAARDALGDLLIS